MLPRALRLKRPLHHCNACDPFDALRFLMACGRKVRKSVDMLHNPRVGRSDRFPAGGGALVRFDFHESGCLGWTCTINLPGQSRAHC